MVSSNFTALIEKHEDWFLGYCPEVPGANGQGRTEVNCRKSLADAIALLQEDADAESKSTQTNLFIHLLHLGRVPFAEALEIQQRVVAARKQNLICDTLLLLEHPPVITLGRNASRANILAGDDLLKMRGVELHEINRGGDVTYHGPGQLVGYPIMDLRGDFPGKRGPHLGPVDFVRMLEEVLIRTCAGFGVMAKRIPRCTGVWTFGGDPASQVSEARPRAPAIEKKLAAIGIHVSQGVTSHGFALNVTTDLRDFGWIVPCGITGRGVTSLELEAEPSADPTMERAVNATARNFGRVFARQMLWCESLEQLLGAG
jgi:lipoyl(octanoyl) transferase